MDVCASLNLPKVREDGRTISIFTVIKAPSPRWNAVLQNVSLSIFVKQDVIDFVLIRPLKFVYFFLWLNELKQINRWLQTILKLSEN